MLKRILFLTLLSLLPFFVVAAPADSERILSFTSDIHVYTDASVDIKETLQVVVKGRVIKRGIVREIPTIYRDQLGNKVSIHFKLLGIKEDGNSAAYFTKSASNGIKIYVGEKNTYLEPGIHTYSIEYRVKNVIGYFNDFDELYWNITGNDWRFPIMQATANIAVENNASFTQYTAYTGSTGSKGKNYTASQQGSTLTVVTTSTLNPGQGLTVAVAWPKGIVPQPTKLQSLQDGFKQNVSFYLLVIIFLSQICYYLFSWWHVGRGPSKGTIFPVFEPPHGFSPAALRFIKHLSYDIKTFSSAIISMAVKGFLKIEEKSRGSITLIKIKESLQGLSIGEKAVAKELFASRGSIKMEKENHATIKAARETHKKKLYSEFNNRYFISNSVYLIPGILLTLLAFLIVALGVYNGDESPDILFFAPFSAIVLAIFYQAYKTSKLSSIITVIIFASALFFQLGHLNRQIITEVALISTIIALNLLFHQLLKAHTLKGRRLLNKVDGFSLYLEKAEKYRLQQEKSLTLFETLLPFAIALDVEQAWAASFSDVITKAMIEQPDNQRWYTSRYGSDRSPTSIVESLGSSFTSTIASASTAPGSSSGSGGGGSSGGGGGGGGGGGW